jgi:acyl dehydratase
VLERRESKSRPDVGIVKVRTIGYNQGGKTVISFIRTVMVFKRGRAPAMPQPAP